MTSLLQLKLFSWQELILFLINNIMTLVQTLNALRYVILYTVSNLSYLKNKLMNHSHNSMINSFLIET